MFWGRVVFIVTCISYKISVFLNRGSQYCVRIKVLNQVILRVWQTKYFTFVYLISNRYKYYYYSLLYYLSTLLSNYHHTLFWYGLQVSNAEDCSFISRSLWFTEWNKHVPTHVTPLTGKSTQKTFSLLHRPRFSMPINLK